MKSIFSKFAAIALTFGFALSPLAWQGAAFADVSVLPAEIAQHQTADPAETRPALWKIADEDTTIYLFGTIHVLPAGIDWFHGKVARAFDESDALVTEIVEADPATMQALIVQKAVLPPGTSLRSLLSPEQRQAYEAAMMQFGFPPAMFDRFEIWYAAVGLSTLPLMQEGYATENGVEQLLEARADELGIPHSGLETTELQLDLFDGLPTDVQAHYLAEVLDQLPKLKEELRKMVEAWKHGDAEELARLMNAGESDPVLIETLLTNRNKAWAEWVDERLDEPGTVFLAVGAGHLAGDGSLQEQLKQLGIASERLQ